MLEIRYVTKYYGKKQVLNGVNIKFDNGIYGLLGVNGAGKTTLINIITGLLDMTQGQILYNGENVKKNKTLYRSKLGYMPQYSTFYPNFTAEEFLTYMCTIKGIPKKLQKKRINEMLEYVNLEKERGKKIGDFSGGMRQRIGIAQAILNDPKILILDEPTAGLDPAERIRFRNLISDLATERIIILATHIVQDVEYIANQVMILHDGNVLVEGAPKQLISKLEGRVSMCNVSKENMNSIVQKSVVSNVFFESDIYTLRTIQDVEVKDNVGVVKPNLEDVFLYYTQKGIIGQVSNDKI